MSPRTWRIALGTLAVLSFAAAIPLSVLSDQVANLAYAIVTGLLVGVYAGLVLLATGVFRFHSGVAVAVSTLVAAALFSPVRRRVQHGVDRRFNRARYDAERTVNEFAGRLQDVVDPDAVRADLAGVVDAALEPTHVSVWLSR